MLRIFLAPSYYSVLSGWLKSFSHVLCFHVWFFLIFFPRFSHIILVIFWISITMVNYLLIRCVYWSIIERGEIILKIPGIKFPILFLSFTGFSLLSLSWKIEFFLRFSFTLDKVLNFCYRKVFLGIFFLLSKKWRIFKTFARENWFLLAKFFFFFKKQKWERGKIYSISNKSASWKENWLGMAERVFAPVLFAYCLSVGFGWFMGGG